MLSSADVEQLLKEYITDSEVRKDLSANGITIGYSDAEIIRIATEFKDTLIEYFLSHTHHDDPSLARAYFDNVSVKLPISQKNTMKINITFRDKALYRPSLFKNTVDYRKTHIDMTGEGVDDIFALFTNGTSISVAHPFFGRWMYGVRSHFKNQENDGDAESESDNLYAARLERESNSFIVDIANEFMAKYPGIRIKLPTDWIGEQEE